MCKHTQRRRRRSVLTALAAIALVGCDSGSPMEADMLTLEDLAGVWEVRSFTYTSNADSSVSFGLVDAGGWAAFSIQPQGNFTGQIVLPDDMPQFGGMSFPVAGIMRLTESDARLRIDFVPELPPFFVTMEPDFEMQVDEIVLNETNDVFDFDQDGVGESATFYAVLRRR